MTMPGRTHIPVYMVWGLLLLAIAAPWLGLYPVLGMRMMCFALYACAFNLLAGEYDNPFEDNVAIHDGDIYLHLQ